MSETPTPQYQPAEKHREVIDYGDGIKRNVDYYSQFILPSSRSPLWDDMVNRVRKGQSTRYPLGVVRDDGYLVWSDNGPNHEYLLGTEGISYKAHAASVDITGHPREGRPFLAVRIIQKENSGETVKKLIEYLDRSIRDKNKILLIINQEGEHGAWRTTFEGSFDTYLKSTESSP